MLTQRAFRVLVYSMSEIDEKIVELLKSGKSALYAANVTGEKYARVRTIKQELGVRKAGNLTHDDVVRLYTVDCLSMRDIARQAGTSKQYIHAVLKRRGVKSAPIGIRRKVRKAHGVSA